MTLQSQDLISALQFRYATKKFDSARKIDAATWEALCRSLVLAPSSFGLQPWRFLVVTNPGIRASLREVSWNQPQITDADRLVVIATRTDMTAADIDAWMACLAQSQGKQPEELAAYREMIDGFVDALDAETRKNWNARQCYIALGQLMTSAAVMGVDTCPLEGIDKAAYDGILGLEGSGYATAVACAIGHRAADDAYATAPKARFAASEVIHEVA
ncbi:MAG: NAD(P)H-dependent oxidoreductase [Luteolibacter sp.]